MISADQTNDALKAVQALIIQARHDAFAAGAKEVGNLLDDMESLPELMADRQDRSREFYDVLEGIAQKHQHCRYIVEKFLQQTPSK